MGNADGFCADPARMRAIGSQVAESAAALKAGYERRREVLSPGVGVAAGWAAAESARDAVRCWEAFLTAVHGSVAGLARSVTSAAGGYERVDADAAQRTNQAGRGVPR